MAAVAALPSCRGSTGRSTRPCGPPFRTTRPIPRVALHACSPRICGPADRTFRTGKTPVVPAARSRRRPPPPSVGGVRPAATTEAWRRYGRDHAKEIGTAVEGLPRHLP